MEITNLYSKEKKRMIVVISHERQFYKLLVFNNIKSKLYESAFDLVENHFEDIEESIILVDKGIEVPEGLEFIRIDRNEIQVLNDLLNKYEFEQETVEENRKSALNTKAVKYKSNENNDEVK